MKAMFAELLLALTAASCAAAESCAPAAPQSEWDAACLAGSGGQRHVKPAHLRKLKFDRSGHALILIGAPRELLAVDRRGVVVVPGIEHAGDVDYPHARRQLARFRAGGKCGYFDQRNFQVRVPASYDQCLPFGEAAAQACNDCESYCTDADCHNRRLIGGRGVELDAHGQVARQFNPPPLTQACGGKPGTLEPGGGARMWLRCPADPQSPFQM